MQLATMYGLAIVSADSRQVYRGFDIGTAKPSQSERARVRHFGIDVVAPTERYSAFAWASGAATWCEDARTQGTTPVVVGGTGLYVRALIEPLDEMPALDVAQRKGLASWLDTLDRETLTRWCARLDPARATLGRTQQLRAVETALLSGTRLSDRLTVSSALPRTTTPARYLVVDPGVPLATRIVERVHGMLDAGWREEIDRLRDTVPDDAPAWKASGYAVLRASRAGQMSEAEAIDRVIIETRQYAKRQRTWFRHQLPEDAVTRIDSLAPDAVERACTWWEDGQR